MLSTPVSLPLPDPLAAAHSATLVQVLAGDIAAAGGWLSFARFMEGLLYTPGLGYYAAGAARFNAAGDFTTAPEISPLFARTLARALAPGLRHLQAGGPVLLLEPGAGTGRLALALLPALAALDAVPDCYSILEPSPALQEQQRATLRALPADLFARVEWLAAPPSGAWRGALLANEVLDALPVHVLQVGPRQDLQELGVVLAPAGGFAWDARPASVALQAAVPPGVCAALPVDTRFELALAARAWAVSVCAHLQEGIVLLVDYGYPARELFHPQRSAGTLRCHYRHHAHDDPFFLPGLQDVTAHVDFTAVAGALRAAGFTLCDFAGQGAFLLEHGLLETLDPALEPGTTAWLRQTTALQQLVSPAELGAVFKVLAAVRQADAQAAWTDLFAGPGPQHVARQLGLP